MGTKPVYKDHEKLGGKDVATQNKSHLSSFILKGRGKAGCWLAHSFLTSDGKSRNIPAQSASGEKGKLRKGECEAGLCQAVDFRVVWKADLR